jgi:hypothetical protein
MLISSITFADDLLSKQEEVNHCLNPQAAKENEAIVKLYPTDTTLIKLAAIRIGLCEFVDKGIIDVRTATEIFEVEQVKSVRDRWKENIETSEDITL